jgi:organic radical activating enzyme
LSEKEYILTVTYKCNWFCEYCSEDTHNKSEVFLETVLEKIDLLHNKIVTLTGGEPGILDKDSLEKIINKLLKNNCKIRVNTNGLFIEKYPEFNKYIDKYIYHCSENLEVDFKRYDKDNIDYVIVATDNNYDKMEKFLDHNKDIEFIILGAKRSKVKLSYKNAFKLYKIIKDKDNVNKESLSQIISLKQDNLIFMRGV